MIHIKPVKLVLLGNPFGKQRPRKSKFLKGLYTPTKTTKYESYVRQLALMANHDVDCPLIVDIKAVFAVPKSYTKKKRKDCLAGKIPPTKKPDKDNIEKIILDGLNPLTKTNKATHKKEVVMPGFYLDDKQVVDGRTYKVYGEKAMVEITIYPYGTKLEDFKENEVEKYVAKSDIK